MPAVKLDDIEDYALIARSVDRPMGVIHIYSPRKYQERGRTRLSALIERPGWNSPKELWVEVDDEFAFGFCSDRGDAFVFALLTYAMRHAYDIQSDAPVTEEMLYNLRTYFIPGIVKGSASHKLYATKIFCQACNDSPTGATGVGTGISCGIDSLHSVLSHIGDDVLPGKRLTHLLLNNVGAYREGTHQFEWQEKNAKRFGEEMGLKVVVTNSNLADLFHYNQYHYKTQHDSSNLFCVLALRNMFATFLSASGGSTLEEFTLRKVDDDACDYYAPFTFECVSTRSLRIYSEGMVKSRYEKTRFVARHEIATRYLHVCTDDSGPNCGKCIKCRRTLTTLDAIGALDQFSSVFNIEYYKKNRVWYISQIYRAGKCGSAEAHMITKETIDVLSQKYLSRLVRFKISAMVWCASVLRIPMVRKVYEIIYGQGGRSSVRYAP